GERDGETGMHTDAGHGNMVAQRCLLSALHQPVPACSARSRGPIPRPNGATILPLASLQPERGLAPHRYPQRPKSPFDRRNLGQAAGLHQLTLCDRLLPFRLNLLFTEAEKPRPMATMSRQPGNQGFRPFRTNRRYFNNIDGPATFSGAGPYLLAARSVCLPAQESRNIELVLVGRIMHRRGPSVRVQALRSGPPGVFRDRLAVGLTGRGTHRPLDRRRRMPTEASRCISDIRRFSGWSSPSSPRCALISFCAGSGNSSMRGMRGVRTTPRSGAGGMKVAAKGCSAGGASAAAGSNSDGLTGIGRIETSPAGGRMAAATAACAASMLAAVAGCARSMRSAIRRVSVRTLPASSLSAV